MLLLPSVGAHPMQASFRRKGKRSGGVPEGIVTLGIVKKTEQEFAEWMAAEWGFLCGLASFDDEPLALEPYSYNLDDAKEKILIARQVHEELPLAYQSASS